MKEKRLEPVEYVVGKCAMKTGEKGCVEYVKQLYVKAAARNYPWVTVLYAGNLYAVLAQRKSAQL